MLSNLKTLFDSIKSGLSFSQRRTVLQSDASSSQSEQKHGLDNFISNRHSDSGERFSISQWDSLEELKEVGHGAFGVVYRAWDPVLRRYVALKLFRADEGQIEEARKLAQVNSPNIVKIFRFETHEGYPGFTMEFIEGLTLADEIEQGAPLDCKAAAAIGIDLCKAVSAVHSAGLLHRDIKAQNVMREASGRMVLMDFGLGENMNNPDVGDSLAGTLPYMAPELFAGARASVSTDVYSLGVLLYFLVSGEYPVSANRISGFRKAHAVSSTVALRQNGRSIKRQFAKIVERAIATDPSRRYSTAEELAVALTKWRERRAGRRILVVSSTAAIGLATIIYPMTRPAVRKFRLLRVPTDAEISMEPTLSADGQMVAYESDASGRGDFDIWVRKIDGGKAYRLTDSPAHDTEPTLSPDGKQIAYHSNRSGGGIYIRSTEGGPERLLSSFGHNPKFSPDGTEIAFWMGNEAQFVTQPGKIYVVSAAGGVARQLVPEFKDARHPVWSSDSNELLFQGCDSNCRDIQYDSDWWKMSRAGANPVKTGAMPDVLAQGLSPYLGAVSWQHDNIVFSAYIEHGTNLWEIPISKPFWVFHRNAVPFMSSTEDGVDPSMSHNGVIAFAALRSGVNLYSAPLYSRGKDRAKRLNRDEETDTVPSISADGQQIMYFSRIENSRKMIVKKTDGTEILNVEVPQTTRGLIAASGKVIAYSVEQRQGSQIYIRRAPRWTPVMINSEGEEVADIFDNDRRVLLITRNGIVAFDTETGRQAVLLKDGNFTVDQAQVSPDGKWLVFLVVRDVNHSQIYVAPMGSTLITEQNWIPVTTETTWHDKPRWTRDGKGIVFLSKQDDFLCIWKQRLGADMQAKGEPEPVLHRHEAKSSPMYLSRIAFNLSVARDSILFNAADISSRIWIAR